MIVLLFAGLSCLALLGFQLARPRATAEHQRRAALEAVRSAAGGVQAEAPASRPKFEFPARISALLLRIHLKLWRKQSQDDVSSQLRHAGTSRRLTAERFMVGRVALMIVGVIAGLSLAEGGRRIVLGIVFAGVAGYLPGFLLSRAASRRAAAIDAELPNFVDQLAIAIEAGMSFDAAVSYLAEANDGPLADELHTILSGLRMGESRRAAMRGFAERVGSENAIAFTNAVLSSDQLGSPLAGILRAQAGDLRHRRQMSAEERAQKAPVKMLFPIAIFILPVMFVVILAPAFLGEGLF